MKLIAQLRGTLFALCLLFVAGVFIHAKAEDAGPNVVYSGEDAKVQVFGNAAVITFRVVAWQATSISTTEESQ